jgi:protein-tyrosine-phosphatase
MREPMSQTVKKIVIVCHGNIARSQILHHYVNQCAREANIELDVFSCGTAPAEAYDNVDGLLSEVRMELERRGVAGAVVRDLMGEQTRPKFIQADVILAADAHRLRDVRAFLQLPEQSGKVQLFYEFAGEGTRDFVDTFDPAKGRQDAARFNACFDELHRLAGKIVKRISGAQQ